jgi:hypothetical protein
MMIPTAGYRRMLVKGKESCKDKVEGLGFRGMLVEE